MKKQTVELGQAYRLFNPGCVVLVSVGDGEADNLFALTWNMPVRQDPPMVALLTGKGHHSYPFIARTGELGLNILTAALVDPLLACGQTSGREVPDKFARFGLTREKAEKIDAPLVAEAVAAAECRVCQVIDLGDSALLVAQLLRAVADPACFEGGSWKFENGLELIHHLGGNRFCVSDHVIEGRKL